MMIARKSHGPLICLNLNFHKALIRPKRFISKLTFLMTFEGSPRHFPLFDPHRRYPDLVETLTVFIASPKMAS